MESSRRRTRSTKNNPEENDEEQSSRTTAPKILKSESLKGRETEYDSLKSWISDSMKKKTPLSVYISGQPGTGKTETMRRVIVSLRNSLDSCFLNCASINTKAALLKEIFSSQNFQGRNSQENFEKCIRELDKPLVLILDEIDHLVSRKNSALYSAFQWPYSLSHKVIIVGIANSIDLTERLLPKLMLTDPPKRLVFEPYSKDCIVEILNEKLEEEKSTIDPQAVELCARKVAAMSGDIRTAFHVMKQTNHRLDTTSVAVDAKKNGCREVLGVINSVYSSPLAKARLPHQPRILLAVCLALSKSKKTTFTRNSLFKAYYTACDAIKSPSMDDEDITTAFQSLESQSFIRENKKGELVLQVDWATARSAISDNSMLDQIFVLNL